VKRLNLVDEVLARIPNHGHKPILRFMENGGVQTWNYLTLLSKLIPLAEKLQKQGIQPGDRVALIGGNSPNWILHDLALLSLNAVVVPIHPELPESILTQQIENAACTWMVRQSSEGQLICGKSADFGLSISPLQLQQPIPVNLATIIYTSGTTGQPKGVMLTHDNLIACATTTQSILPFAEDGRVLNILPFSHIYARSSDLYQCLLSGTTLVLSSPDTIEHDLHRFQPTNMHAVPRIYERLWEKAGSLEALREMFGPQVDWMKAGGSMLSPTLVQQYSSAGLLLLQGYGMTECSPVIATETKTIRKLGTIGKPLSILETRLIEEGVLEVRGSSVSPGYWQGESIHDWFSTGDLAEQDADGYLTITGRKKEMIVLSTGRKINPAAIEAVLQQDPAIAQAFVYGDDQHPHPVALLVVQGEFDSVRFQAVQVNLAPWERIEKYKLLAKPFSISAGEITASMKLRRDVIRSQYADMIEKLFEREG
jgi:long-chain acyl-CoA synthetase